jgi:hypothetical protein
MLQVQVIYLIEHPDGYDLLGGSFCPELRDEELTAFL